MAQIVNRMKELVPSLQDVNAISEAMHAIMAIGTTSVSKEESALTNMVPILIDTIRKYPAVNQAIAVVPVITSVLSIGIICTILSLSKQNTTWPSDYSLLALTH